jgi:hypothetical protein
MRVARMMMDALCEAVNDRNNSCQYKLKRRHSRGASNGDGDGDDGDDGDDDGDASVFDWELSPVGAVLLESSSDAVSIDLEGCGTTAEMFTPSYQSHPLCVPRVRVQAHYLPPIIASLEDAFAMLGAPMSCACLMLSSCH